jgi:hypothetical protein
LPIHLSRAVGQLGDVGQWCPAAFRSDSLGFLDTPDYGQRRIVPAHHQLVCGPVTGRTCSRRRRRLSESTTKSWAKPRGIQSGRRGASLSSTETCCPKVALPGRTSTATSHTHPLSTVTSSPWALGFCTCEPRSTPQQDRERLCWTNGPTIPASAQRTAWKVSTKNPGIAENLGFDREHVWKHRLQNVHCRWTWTETSFSISARFSARQSISRSRDRATGVSFAP